jgi:hypothetical protein
VSFIGLVVRLDDANIHACLSTESVASTDSVRYAIGATSKRSGLLLSAVVGVGAIAALSIGASFSLFSATATGNSQNFVAGTVSLYNPVTETCSTNVGSMEPGDTATCNFQVGYNGKLVAYIGSEASATGPLANALSFTINGTTQGSTPVLIGNSYAGGPYTATVAYTLSSSADNSYQGATAAVTVTFYAVQCSNNWANGTALNDQCANPGPASWTQAPANTSSTMYNSTVDPSIYDWSLGYNATNTTELGDEINLANDSAPLNNVVVAMNNFNSYAFSTPITLNIYNTSMSRIATDTQTFTIPAGTGSGTSDSNIVFNFGSHNVTLPSTVIYGIAFDGGVVGSPNNSLNVQLAYGDSQISVGSDTNPGYLFVASGSGSNYIGYPSGEVTCANVSSDFGFQQVPTALEPLGTTYLASSCGMYPLIPAVEFNS